MAPAVPFNLAVEVVWYDATGSLITVTGEAEVGVTVEVQAQGEGFLGNPVPDAGGNWSLGQFFFSVGTHIIEAFAFTNPADPSALASIEFTVSAAAPIAPATPTRLAHIFQALNVNSSAMTRAIGKFQQLVMSDAPGYVVDVNCSRFQFVANGIEYTAEIEVGLYADIVALSSALVLAMNAAAIAQLYSFSHNQTHAIDRPIAVAITGTEVWAPWNIGSNADSTRRLFAMLGFTPVLPSLTSALTQTGDEPVYYRESSDVELATAVIKYGVLGRRP